MAKLIDILVRELKFWPDNNLNETAASFIAQDSDGMIVTLDPEETASASQFNRTEWSRSHWTGDDLVFEIAEDHQTAIITRAQWQAAVDAMKAESPALHLQEVGRITRQWSGEGSPPAGTVCEMHRETYFEIDWQPVTLLCVGQAKAFFRDKEGHEWSRPLRELSFRPIRTPEQIAAEERENELNRMVATVSMLDKGWARKVCAGLYDAGYRKPEIVDE